MKIVLNTDADKVKEIQEGLKKTGGYCPCEFQQTPDTKCMCKAFREQKEGFCHCGLYQKIKEE